MALQTRTEVMLRSLAGKTKCFLFPRVACRRLRWGEHLISSPLHSGEDTLSGRRNRSLPCYLLPATRLPAWQMDDSEFAGERRCVSLDGER